MIVCAAVLGVLLHGVFSHEREAEASAGNILDLPMPPSLPDLRPNLEKTPLTYLSDYYLQLGDQARNKLVLVGQQKLPGLVVTPGVILTSIRAADESMRLRLQRHARQASQPGNDASPAAGPEAGAAAPQASPEEGGDVLVVEVSSLDPEAPAEHLPLIAADPELGIALLEMEQPYMAAPFAPVDPAVLTPGSQLLAVSLLPDGRLEVTPGYLTAPGAGESLDDDEPLHVSITFSKPPAAAAIVDLDGRLVGAAVASPGGGTQLLSSNEVLRIVDRLREGTPCRAIEVRDLAADARRALRLTGGVFVEKVRGEAFLTEPAIQPGDFLLEWDGQAISAADQFYALYDADRPAAVVPFELLRDQKRVNGAAVMPGADCRPVRQLAQVIPSLGLTVQWVASAGGKQAPESAGGWGVLGVTRDSPAASVGVQTGDLIVAINGALLDEAQGAQRLRRLAETPRPCVLTLRRGDRLKLVTVERERR